MTIDHSRLVQIEEYVAANGKQKLSLNPQQVEQIMRKAVVFIEDVEIASRSQDILYLGDHEDTRKVFDLIVRGVVGGLEDEDELGNLTVAGFAKGMLGVFQTLYFDPDFSPAQAQIAKELQTKALIYIRPVLQAGIEGDSELAEMVFTMAIATQEARNELVSQNLQ